ncbi:MAG: transporter substrate-binding domain-containing protein [Culicoidibacterales bacterium]
MKKVMTVAMSMMMAVSLVACGSGSAVSGETEIEAIQTKGEIVMATSPDYPPFEFPLPDGTIVGFDISIAEAIAAELGVDLRIESIDFDGLLPALATNKVDFIIAGLSADEEREKAFGLSDSYYESGFSFLVKAENKETYKTIEDVQAASVVVQKGSVQETYATENGITQLTSLPKMNDMVQYLETNRAEVVIVDSIVAQSYVETGNYAIAFEVTEGSEGGNVVAVDKDHEALLAKINEVIAQLEAEGQLEAFMAEALDLQAQQQ